MKTCPVCKQEKPDSEFYESKKGNNKCKKCHSEYGKEWYQRNKEAVKLKATKWISENKDRRKETTKKWRENHPEQVLAYRRMWREENREQVRANSRNTRYGLTHEVFLSLVEKQNGECAICGKDIDMDKLHIDHNHKTDEVRGILCRTCNVGLGQFSDNPEILQKAIEYLVNNGLNNFIKARAEEVSRNDLPA